MLPRVVAWWRHARRRVPELVARLWRRQLGVAKSLLLLRLRLRLLRLFLLLLRPLLLLLLLLL